MIAEIRLSIKSSDAQISEVLGLHRWKTVYVDAFLVIAHSLDPLDFATAGGTLLRDLSGLGGITSITLRNYW